MSYFVPRAASNVFVSDGIGRFERRASLRDAWFEAHSPSRYDDPCNTHIELVLPIKRLPGGSKSLLMMCARGELWVVKFQDNPQHRRVLANDFIATHIAGSIGLSVPKCAAVRVSREAVGLAGIDGFRVSEGIDIGAPQFGSRFVGGLLPGLVTSELLPRDFAKVSNLKEFAGMLALDRWLDNTDTRQAVFVRSAREQRYRAAFIDNGHCFGCGRWDFSDSIVAGVYANRMAYSAVNCWSAFDPWITRIEQFPEERLWKIAAAVPEEWCAGQRSVLNNLIRTLIERRSEVRAGIRRLSESKYNPFDRQSLSLN